MSQLIKNVSLSFHLLDGTICSIENIVIEHLQDVVQNEQKANPFPWKQNDFESSIHSSHICVGVFIDKNTLIAHGVFSVAADEAELLNIAVIPEFQGRGIAKTLIEKICTELQELAQEIFLEVRISNKNAIGLYESLGFNCLGERPNYYPVSPGEREDALIYGKTLKL